MEDVGIADQGNKVGMVACSFSQFTFSSEILFMLQFSIWVNLFNTQLIVLSSAVKLKVSPLTPYNYVRLIPQKFFSLNYSETDKTRLKP